MAAVPVFLLVFTCAWVACTYGTTALLIAVPLAVVAWALVEVVLPTLWANRAWFAWHLAARAPRPRAAVPTATVAPVEPEERHATGRPDLARELQVDGWDTWAAGHRLRIVDVAADPGHPGADLTLFEITAGRWTGTRLVQVIDASPNQRGVHERHAIPVPPHCSTAIEAVAATWGLAPDAYRPVRHT